MTKLINIVLVFLSSVFLARILGPETYGTYVFVMSLIGLVSWASCLGFPALLTREIARLDHDQNWNEIGGLIQRSNQFVIAVSIFLILLSIAVYAIFSVADANNRWNLLLLALPIVPAAGLSSLRGAALRGLRKVTLGTTPELVVRPTSFLVLLVSIWAAHIASIENVIIAQIVSAYIAFLVGAHIFKKLTVSKLGHEPHEYRTREWIKLLVPFSGIAAVSYLNVEFISLFLGLNGNDQELAFFRIAGNLALLVALPLSLVETVTMPYITRLYNARDILALTKLTKQASLASFCISSLPAVILICFGETVLELVYGAEYVAAYATMVTIVLGYLLVNLVGLSMQLLYATNFHNTAFKISLVGAAITVLFCAILIPIFGAFGAGIVLGFGKALRAFLFVYSARKLLKIKTSILW